MNLAECRSYLERVEVYGIKFGLDSIRKVLRSLGDPQTRFPSVLVAGTNGKGSVAAMLTEALSRNGLRTGLYTSPHLVFVEERVRVGRRLISSSDFCRLLSRVKTAGDRLVQSGTLKGPLTYFEHLTALAFLYFREKKVDIAVLEVGMGGRFDATNVVTPIVSVITSIGLDHQKYLGSTLSRIAAEKAGIIKPGVPVVSGLPAGTARRVIRKKAGESGSPLLETQAGDGAYRAERKRAGYRFVFRHQGKTFRFRPRLQGLHQGRNAAVALAAALVLSETWRGLDLQKVLAGIEGAEWPGRLEVVSRRPLVVLDGAHNVEGAGALAAYVRDFLPRPVFLVFAVMGDKDYRPIIRLLFPLARKIFLTSMPMPRAAAPQEVLSAATAFRKKVMIEPDVRRALGRARSLAQTAQGSVLAAGSLFLVGEIKKRRLLFQEKSDKIPL